MAMGRGSRGGSYGTGGKRAGADSAGAVGNEASDDGGWSGGGAGLGGRGGDGTTGVRGYRDLMDRYGYNMAVDFGLVSDASRSVMENAVDAGLADYDATKPPPKEYMDALMSVVTSVAAPINSLAAVNAMRALASKDKTAREDAKARMREHGVPESVIANAEATMSRFGDSSMDSSPAAPNGGTGQGASGNQPGGASAGGGLELGSNIGTPEGGVSPLSNVTAEDAGRTMMGLWDQFVDQYMGQGGAPGMEQIAAEDDAAMKQMTQSYLDKMYEAQQNQQGVLGGLLRDAENREGLYTPITLNIAGNRIPITTRRGMAQANQMADLANQRMVGAQGTYDSMYDKADVMTPNSGRRNYLDSLQKIAARDAILRNQQARTMLAGRGQDFLEEQAEPSFLDWMGGFADTAGKIWDVGNDFDWWG